MNVPATGLPSLVALAKVLILKLLIGVVAFTNAWSLNPAGWCHNKNT